MTVSGTIDVVYQRLPGDITGLYDRLHNVIIIDPRCDPATRRSTEEHERVHAERGDTACDDEWFEAKQELAVEREAARRLVSVPDLIDGIRWCHDDRELAEWLEVDLDMLHTRFGMLTPDEVAWIEGEIDAMERSA